MTTLHTAQQTSAALQDLAAQAHTKWLVDHVGPSLGHPVPDTPLALLESERRRIQHARDEALLFSERMLANLAENQKAIETLNTRLKAFDDAIIPLLPENQRPGIFKNPSVSIDKNGDRS